MHFQKLVEGKPEHKKNTNNNIDQLVDNLLIEKKFLSHQNEIKSYNQNKRKKSYKYIGE